MYIYELCRCALYSLVPILIRVVTDAWKSLGNVCVFVCSVYYSWHQLECVWARKEVLIIFKETWRLQWRQHLFILFQRNFVRSVSTVGTLKRGRWDVQLPMFGGWIRWIGLDLNCSENRADMVFQSKHRKHMKNGISLNKWVKRPNECDGNWQKKNWFHMKTWFQFLFALLLLNANFLSSAAVWRVSSGNVFSWNSSFCCWCCYILKIYIITNIARGGTHGA